ncbi:MAG: hypothetical protein GKC04_01945 [Methanomicrobiales archaeon]|nr:hypothetical protein [Methanomicrobiales archaeon]
MTPQKTPALAAIVLSRLAGIGVFLVIAGALSLLATEGAPPALQAVSAFFTRNIGLVLLFSVLFLLGEVFRALPFPASLPGPFAAAAGSVLLVMFLVRLLLLTGTFSGISVFEGLPDFARLLYPAVFLLVLLAGLADCVRQAYGHD